MKDVAHQRLSPSELIALVHGAQRGEHDKQSALFHATVAMTHRLLTRFSGTRTDVDDLVQIVYLECFRSLPSFRGESSFTTWLGSICVRVALQHKRRARLFSFRLGRSAELTLVQNVEPPSVEAELGRKQDYHAALARLQTLKPRHRIAFVLHVLEEHDVKTVAAMTQQSVAATYKNIERARVALMRLSERGAK